MILTKVLPLIKTLEKDYAIAPDSDLVIDARSFYFNTYKDSGCQYILGGEYDRYADYLRKLFNKFLDIRVTCFVVFGGTSTFADMGHRLEIHKKIMDKTNCIDPTKPDIFFSEPIFARDVFKEVLNELGIQYAVCEYGNVEEVVNLAKHYGCPLLTRHVEYSLFQVPCISPKSLTYHDRSIVCKMYEPDLCHKRIGFDYCKLAMFMVLLDDNNDYLRDLERLITFHENNVVYRVHHFIFRQTMETLLSDFRKEMARSRYEKLVNDYNVVKDLMIHKKNTLIQKHFQKSDVTSENWYAIGVITDRIPTCYVNLKKSGTFSGSWLVSDNSKEDPMLASMNIVRLAFQLLTNFRGTKITFLGRVGTLSQVWDICGSIDIKRAEGTVGEVFENGWSTDTLTDYFSYFFQTELPGLNLGALNLIPADCRVLMMALVYYSAKNNGDKLALVYSVMLSYTMLGPVAKATGLLKRSNFTLIRNEHSNSCATTADGLLKSDCFVAARAMMNYFYCDNVAEKFDRKELHSFAEFQHCLQQLNYLNRLCGERMQRTVYHKCYNATFIYNVFFELRLNTGPMALANIEMWLRESPSVLKYFNHLVSVFECMQSLSRTELSDRVDSIQQCVPTLHRNPSQSSDATSDTSPSEAEASPTGAGLSGFGNGVSLTRSQVAATPARKKKRLSGAQKKRRALERLESVGDAPKKVCQVSDEVTDLAGVSKEVLVGRKMAIIADGTPWRLTPERCRPIMNEIQKLLATTPVLPQMDCTGLSAGAVLFDCDAEIDAQWLCALDGQTIGGVKLRVVDSKDLPKLVKLAWKSKNNFTDVSKELFILHRYHPKLNISEWKVVSSQQNPDIGSVRRIVLVDQDSAAYIRWHDYCLRSGLQKAYFKLLECPGRGVVATSGSVSACTDVLHADAAMATAVAVATVTSVQSGSAAAPDQVS